jgi:hypothetical protein
LARIIVCSCKIIALFGENIFITAKLSFILARMVDFYVLTFRWLPLYWSLLMTEICLTLSGESIPAEMKDNPAGITVNPADLNCIPFKILDNPAKIADNPAD